MVARLLGRVVRYMFLIIPAISQILKKTLSFDRSPFGFRVLAGFSLALILYLTEYQPDMLKPGFMSTMTNLYHESNAGQMLPPDLVRFSPAFALVAFTLIGNLFSSDLSLESVLSKLK